MNGGAYLIELLDTKDRILAVGQPLVVLPGETVATFVRLSDTAFDDSQLFGWSAPVMLTAATDAGVTPAGGGRAASNEF